MSQLIQDVEDSLQRLNGAAVLDILLIAAIIYALLMALRGTTAMTLLRGAVVFVCVLFLLGQVLSLAVVNFIMRNSLPGLVLGAIVVFQPEIRRALERAGRTSVRNWLSTSPQDVAIDEISTAVVELSRLRHGAIIVIERATGLEDYIETGVRIDAGLNARLIESIFYPNSPLHDKALITRNDRIVAASCTLPLATGAASSRLGTRHRAALGISEVTDAIAIVVSEQSSAISIASEGRLIPLRDETRVRATLEALAVRRPGIRTPAPPVPVG
jgi:diadenylate cyclase